MNLHNESDQKWYTTAFGRMYRLFYAHRSPEAASEELAGLLPLLKLSPGARVLDLCCGAGRHLAELCRRGFTAYGLDYSPDLLKGAAEVPVLQGCLIRGDMRFLPFPCEFDCVINLFSSFGYFADDAENRRVLSEIARVVAPGGQVVIDHMNRRHVEAHLVAESEDLLEEGVLRQKRRIQGNRVIKHITWIPEHGREERFTEDVRLYTPEELKQMLEGCGFTSVQFQGSFSGGAFTASSERMICRAVRKV